ncbi:MAG: hypothetical protein KKF26_01570 [Chloroflexi bacterium]|nr:hypothetical protein [Chloroflexota bacterium]
MKICIETSAIIGFLKGEFDCQPIEQLLTLAEAGEVEILVSSFAWDEVYKPLNELGNSKKERLRQMVQHLPKVARSGEWRLGFDVLGHEGSAEIEHSLSRASRSDKEQFLSYASLGLDFFVTKDKHFLKESVRTDFKRKYSFQVGNPKDCVDWIKKSQTS